MNESKTKPCGYCGKELPLAVTDAGAFLYGGTQLGVERLCQLIEQGLKSKARRNAERASSEAPLLTLTDAEIADEAIRDLIDVDPEALARGVRHWGDLGHPDGSECERTKRGRTASSERR